MPLWPVWKSAGRPGFRDDLVQRVRAAVVREERLQVRVELEALDAVLRDQAAGALDGVGPSRVDARERDQDVRVRGRGLGDLLVRDRRDPAARLPVDREDDRGHAALAVVLGDVVDGRQRLVAAEVAPRRRAELRRHRVVPVARELGVHVDVDRGERGDVDHGGSPSRARPGAPRPSRADPSRRRERRSARRSPAARCACPRRTEARRRESPSSPSSA